MTPHRKLELERGFIAVVALLISAIFLWMIRDYLAALFLAAVLTLFLQRPQDWLSSKLGGRKGLSAGLLVTGAFLAVVIPTALLLGVIAEQAIEVTAMVSPWVEQQISDIRENGLHLPDWIPFREEVIRYQETITAQLGDLASTVGGILVSTLRSGTGGVLVATLNFFILIYALFFFLLTGRDSGRKAVSLIPMTTKDRELLAERAVSTIRATVKGSFLIALVQGGLTGIGLFVAGVPGAIFWAAIAALLSIIPMIGPPLIWVPAAIWLFVSGHPIAAAGLAVWGGIVVSTSDNILRPILVGKDAKMSDLMVLISTLGGLTLFGAVGIIIGPVIAALFSSVWFIFREAFGSLLEEDSDRETSRLFLKPLPPESLLAMIESEAEFSRIFGTRVEAGLREFFVFDEVREGWADELRALEGPDPWTLGYALIEKESATAVGTVSFKGQPNAGGSVELAYGIVPAREGRGLASEALEEACAFAFEDDRVTAIYAHTLPDAEASCRVLEKCGFNRDGEVEHPEDGSVWRWVLRKPAN
jgi:predicted PurR-regulated permease PerM/RimJ/RimL family protein N-acetyltransferase